MSAASDTHPEGPLTPELRLLLRIDQLDRAILACQEARASLKSATRDAREEIDQQNLALEQAQQDLQTLEQLQVTREAELKRTEDRIRRLKDFDHVTSEKELEVARKQLELLHQQRDSLELSLLEGYESQETRGAEIKAGQARLARLKARYAQEQPERKVRFDALGLEVDTHQAERRDELRGLKGDLRDAYDRALELHPGRAVTDVEDDRCRPCNMPVPAQHVVNILLGRSFHVCAHCRRLILPTGAL